MEGEEFSKRKKSLGEDSDLLFLTEVLLDIHKKYYEEGVVDVRDLLEERKGVFKGKKFFVEGDSHVSRLIRMYGGVLVDHPGESDLIYSTLKRNEQLSSCHGPSRNIPIVSFMHLYASIYKLKFMPLEKFILGILEHDQDDSDVDTIDSIINDIEEDLF